MLHNTYHLFLELRSQLKKLQSLVVQTPELVIHSFVKDHSSTTQEFVERLEKENNETVAKLENQRVCILSVGQL